MSEKLLNWIRPQIRRLSAYPVPDASGLIKLDAMENPYVLPAELPKNLLGQWQLSLAGAELNRYPDPAATRLKQKLAKVMNVPENRAILLGNGSDELIQMLALSVSGFDRCLLSFEPGFVMYRMIAEFTGMLYAGVPLGIDFSLDMEATRKAIEQHQPAIIFIAYPNNPTGNLFSEKDIEEIIRLAPGFVVLDEAYHPFAQASFMNRLEQFDQLLVMRTVSKMGLAGLRLGMLCGLPELINEIDKLRLPYNINILTQITACFALEHIAILDDQASRLRAQRETMLKKMNVISGIRVYPSKANFILFKVEQGNANRIFESIRNDGVLIKNLNTTSGALQNCLRVTVGKPEENTAFLASLVKAL